MLAARGGREFSLSFSFSFLLSLLKPSVRRDFGSGLKAKCFCDETAHVVFILDIFVASNLPNIFLYMYGTFNLQIKLHFILECDS